MTTKTRNWLLAIFILAFPFVLFLGCLIFMAAEPLPPLAPLPNPNGYDNLVDAGKMVTNEIAIPLRELVERNTAGLTLARTGLSNQCIVPVQYSEFYISNHLDNLAGLKILAQAFVAEGLLTIMDGRTNEAVHSFLDAVHLGNETMRGGIVIDALVGIAINAKATSCIQSLIPYLDAKTCRETAVALETLNAQRPDWNEVKQRESDWSRGTFRGWRYELMRLESGKTMNAAIAASGRKFNAQVQKTRQLIIDLAARAYELEKGKPPASVADLVPVYLKAIPQDPVTGKTLN